MKIKINSLWLAAGGLEGAGDFNISSSQVVDPAALFRALAQTFFARGNWSTPITFTVKRKHDSVKEAEVFLLTHRNDIPNSGDVYFYCGYDDDQQIVTLQGTAVQGVVGTYLGNNTFFTYSLIGGQTRTDITPGGGEPDPDVTRRANTAVASAATSLDIVFSTPMTSTPICNATMRIPDGGDAVFCWIKKGSESASGFTVVFRAPIPGSGYEVAWFAIL